MKFNRHSRRRMKFYGVTVQDVEAVMASAEAVVDHDQHGNPRHTATVGGRVVRVVVSAEDPEMVKSAYTRRK